MVECNSKNPKDKPVYVRMQDQEFQLDLQYLWMM